MPGPTTESLATDFRDVLREITAIRSDIASLREDHAGFRGRVETKLGLIQWLGAFTAAILVTLVTSAIWLAWHASALTQQVDTLNRTNVKIIERLDQPNTPVKPKPATP